MLGADSVIVFTKGFELSVQGESSPRLKAIPGMLVPPRYRNPVAFKYFREKFGDDAVRVMKVDEFSNSGSLSGESIETLKALRVACEAQATELTAKTETIQKLEAEIAALKKASRQPAVSNKS